MTDRFTAAQPVGGLVLATTKFVRFFVQVAILGVGALLVVNSRLNAGALIAGRALIELDRAIVRFRGQRRHSPDGLECFDWNHPSKGDPPLVLPHRQKLEQLEARMDEIADWVAHERTGAARERTSTHEAQRPSH
jgi:ABC-type protease/lipase transport system fused ATPase/permease subunit